MLIAEYLTLVKYIGLNEHLRLDDPSLPQPTVADFARANFLAARCMIELPKDTWNDVLNLVKQDNWTNSVFAMVKMLREVNFRDWALMDEQFVRHAPGIHRPGRRACSP